MRKGLLRPLLWGLRLELLLTHGPPSDVRADLMQHLAEDLDALIVDILKQGLNAGLDDGLLDLILDEQLNEQAHVAKQLELLPVLDLVRVIYE